MKWIPVFFLCALSLAFNACEMHPASQLEDAHGTAEAHPPAAKHEPAASPDTKPAEGEAPKFFPEKK